MHPQEADIHHTLPVSPILPGADEPPDGVATPVVLGELAASEGSLHWSEAVAIAQEVCRVVPDAPAAALTEPPDLADLAITRAGEVVVSTTWPAREEAVSWAARVLNALLSGDVPVQLRLVVAQATSSPPAFESLEEFSRAVGYFERPGRTQLIRAVWERWQTMPRPSGTARSDVTLARLSPAAESPRQPTPPRPVTKRRHAMWVVVAAVLIPGVPLAVILRD